MKTRWADESTVGPVSPSSAAALDGENGGADAQSTAQTPNFGADVAGGVKEKMRANVLAALLALEPTDQKAKVSFSLFKEVVNQYDQRLV